MQSTSAMMALDHLYYPQGMMGSLGSKDGSLGRVIYKIVLNGALMLGLICGELNASTNTDVSAIQKLRMLHAETLFV